MSVRKHRPWPEIPRIERGRDDVAVVREVADATSALNKHTNAWLAFLPRPASVDVARNQVSGIGRLLTELAILQEAANGG